MAVAEILSLMGFRYMQGNYFSKSVIAEKAMSMDDRYIDRNATLDVAKAIEIADDKKEEFFTFMLYQISCIRLLSNQNADILDFDFSEYKKRYEKFKQIQIFVPETMRVANELIENVISTHLNGYNKANFMEKLSHYEIRILNSLYKRGGE